MRTMIPPKRKRVCPKKGHLVEYPGHSGHAPTWDKGVGLVVDTVGISLLILSDHGTILKGIRRDSVEVLNEGG